MSNIKKHLGNIFEEGEVFVNSLSVHHVLRGDGQALKSAAHEGAHRQHLVTFGEVEQLAESLRAGYIREGEGFRV